MTDRNATPDQVPFENSEAASEPPVDTPHKDVVMMDAVPDQASPINNANAATGRNGTPAAQASRAPSTYTDVIFGIPAEAAPHGDSTRRYLNTRVTGTLLEGVRMLAKEQPDDPLRVLGEYLIQKSKELENGN